MKHRFCPHPQPLSQAWERGARAEGSGGVRANHTLNQQRPADGNRYEIATKGAPEAIADLCHFTPQQQQVLTAQVSAMAGQGLRVLGVAKACLLEAPPPFLPPHPSLDIEHLPEQQHDFPFQFLGLVGLSDPVRPTVPAAIAECYTAGIRVVMITGDYPETAQSIARQVGLTQTEAILTGAEVGLAVLQGSGILVIILAIFLVSLYRGQGELDARTLTFTTLLLANLGLILSESSSSHLSLKILKSPNPTLWWTIGGGLVFLGFVLYVPFLQQLFSFSFLHSFAERLPWRIDLVICVAGGAICLLWFELLKLFDRHRRVK